MKRGDFVRIGVVVSCLAVLLLSGALAASSIAYGRAVQQPAVFNTDDVVTVRVADKVSYQGVLKENGLPVTGVRDLLFRLYTDSGCTTQVGADIVLTGVTVVNGLFSVELDVDAASFDGQALWLQPIVSGTAIGCREILPTPYALSLRPGAEIKGSLTASLVGGKPILSVVNTALGSGLFILPTDALQVQSAGADGIDAQGGADSGDYGGEFSGWGGVRTEASTGPGVLAYDAGRVAMTYDQNPGDVVASDDLLADNSIGVGAPGSAGSITVRNGNDHSILQFSAVNGILTLGGNGQDGDLWIRDASLTTRFSVDGATGDMMSMGAKNAVVDTATHGQRKLYVIESPEVWFEDFGTAQLVNGSAVIPFEPIFAETVNLGMNYMVFLTPVGGWASLYVAAKTPTSFTVQTAEGDPNLTFDYRIIAKRLGYETVRLEPVSGGLNAQIGPAATASGEASENQEEWIDVAAEVGVNPQPVYDHAVND